MTDCDCEQALNDLEEFLRNETCHTERGLIAAHLAECPGCQEEALVARTLSVVLARACKETAPDQLRDLVLDRIRAAQS